MTDESPSTRRVRVRLNRIAARRGLVLSASEIERGVEASEVRSALDRAYNRLPAAEPAESRGEVARLIVLEVAQQLNRAQAHGFTVDCDDEGAWLGLRFEGTLIASVALTLDGDGVSWEATW